ncbi:MAG: peptidoglycan editing factor PgeF [Alphaproteobacteria bacterium]|nr:MAG: peptidoglycan editing factor PgeF [Alphaproteobacteria bacterium]
MKHQEKNGIVWFEHPDIQVPGLSCRFFGREGGVSTGPYESLNGRPAASEDPTHIAENKKRVAAVMQADFLHTSTQVHGTKAIWVDDQTQSTGEADALMTQKTGQVLAIKTADCVPIVIMARDGSGCAIIHAGWRGASQGIIAQTLSAFQKPVKAELVAVIGPCIRANNYQVDAAVYAEFSAYENRDLFFKSEKNDDHFYLDLPGFCAYHLKALGVKEVADIGLDTYEDEEVFFSCRRAFHHGQANQFGCQFSCVKIED